MKKATFIALWIAVLAASYVALSLLDMVPLELSELNYRVANEVKVFFSNLFKSEAADVSVLQDAPSVPRVNEAVLPDRIVIEKIDIDAPVVNPQSRDVTVLDNALLNGVVRYPGSGGLDDESNMFLFGHSTTFRTVRNQAFKSLNRLGELELGDVVRVRSEDKEYVYHVTSVVRADKNEALVEFRIGEKMITLSTCDTFGEKDDRFVVEATFVQVLPVSYI